MSCDIPSFLTHFLEKHPKAHIQQLCSHIKETDEAKSLLLIKIFGRLQNERVSQSLSNSLRDSYEIVYRNIVTDFELILESNLVKIKEGRPFSPLKNGKQYSWRKEHFLFSLKDEELANRAVQLFFYTSEMPREISTALNFHKVQFLQLKEIDSISKLVYERFRRSATVSLDTTDTKAFVVFQQTLMQTAAIAESPRFSSWIEELHEFNFIENGKYDDVLQQFQLCRLFDFSKRKSQRVFTPSSSQFKFEASFHHYLIKKTLSPFCAILSSVYDKLVSVFEKSEKDRRAMSFGTWLIREAFYNKNRDLSLILLANPSPEQNLLELVSKILERLTEETDLLTYRALFSLACVCYIDDASQDQLPNEEEEKAFQWVYNQLVNGRFFALPFIKLTGYLIQRYSFLTYIRLLKALMKETESNEAAIDYLLYLYKAWDIPITLNPDPIPMHEVHERKRKLWEEGEELLQKTIPKERYIASYDALHAILYSR